MSNSEFSKKNCKNHKSKDDKILSITPTKSLIIKKGDLVKITGSKYYNGGTVPSWAKAQKWYVREVTGTKVTLDKNENGTNFISNPVNVVDLQIIKSANSAVWIPSVGDIVQYNGFLYYTTANSLIPKRCNGGEAKIIDIHLPGKSKHPYYLIHTGKDATVHGWVDSGTFIKKAIDEIEM